MTIVKILAIIAMGFYTDHGLTRVLDALDYQYIDSVSPFIWTAIDIYCGKADKDPTPRAFTFYCDTLSSIFQRNTRTGWTTGEFEGFQVQIKSFKAFVSRV